MLLIIALSLFNWYLGYTAGKVKGFNIGINYSALLAKAMARVHQLADLKGEDAKLLHPDEYNRRLNEQMKLLQEKE